MLNDVLCVNRELKCSVYDVYDEWMNKCLTAGKSPRVVSPVSHVT